MALTSSGSQPRTVESGSAGILRLGRIDFLYIALLAGLTFAVASHFAPRGFRGGFTDMAHDGYQLRQVLDLDRGGTIFKDTFDQYGPLAGYLNLFAYRVLGRNLLAVKYGICLWYTATSVLVYLLGRHLLTPVFSVVSVVLWLALAPFYGHGVMISPHAQVLFFQAAAMLSAIRFAERGGLVWLVAAGVGCGVCWALKTPIGVLFAVGVSAYLAIPFLERRVGARRALTMQSVFLGGAACVAAITIALLASAGALHDWYLQTMVFPKAFYIDQMGAGVGPLASILKFARRFVELNFDRTSVPVSPYWHLMRLVATCGAFVLWRRRQAPEALVLAGCVTPVLWLGAYPSAYYMHQWWTTSLSIAAFVYCVRRAVKFADDRWAAGELLQREPVLCVSVLALIFSPAIEERWRYARERESTLTQTFDAPASIVGIRTDKQTLTGFRTLYTAIQNFKQHHPSARIVSRDHCDGYTNCVPESLLWLSFLEDNTHSHPVYWPIPVLTTAIYTDYQSRFRSELERTHPLVVDTWTGPFRPGNILPGYRLLVGVRTETGYWYLLAPDHQAAEEHGEIQVRLEAPPPAAIPAVVAGMLPAGNVRAGKLPDGSLPVGNVPVGNVTVGNVPAVKLPAGNVPAVKLPAVKLPAVKLPAGKLPASNLPVGNVPIGNVTVGNVPVRNAPVGTLGAGKPPASSDAGPPSDGIAVEGALRTGMHLSVAGEKTSGRRLYTWPADVGVPGAPSRLEPLNAAAAGRAKTVTIDRGRWVVRGSAEARFSYLLYFKERSVHAGEYFLATGHLEEGGLSIGLQRNDTWAGIVNVTAPGPFTVVLMPDSGRYSLVLANNVTTTREQLFDRYGRLAAVWKILAGATLPNAFEIDRAGWTSASR
jgi:hypothetical protein